MDGYNVLHAVLLSAERKHAATQSAQMEAPVEGLTWWAPVFQRRVVDWAEELYALLEQSTGEPNPDPGVVPERVRLTVVFDASTTADDHEPVTSKLVTVVFAANADDWIVQACERELATVITADRALANRAAVFGARSVKPWSVVKSWDVNEKCALRTR